MAIYHENIVDIELECGSLHRSFLRHSIGSGDAEANRFGVRVFRRGEPVDLDGCTCEGFFRNPRGENIALTSHGEVSVNTAYVTLPQECYDYEGQFCLSIKLIGGGVTGTMRIVDGMVDNTHTDNPVTPLAAVPTYQEILAVYDDMSDFMDESEDTIKQLQGGLSAAMVTASRLSGRTIGWVQGAIKSSDGSNSSSTTRIRTPGSGESYYRRELVNHLVAKPGYKFMVFLYSGTSYSTYQGVYNGYSIETTGTWRTDLVLGWDNDSYYFRVVLAKDDDSTITTDDADNLLFYTSVDTSLTMRGVPADAKTVGDRIAEAGIMRKKIRIMQYNIGDYVWGFNPSTKKLTAAEYPQKLAAYKRLFGDMLPDILCLQEFNQHFSVEGAAADAYPSQTLLFNPVFKEDTISSDSSMTVAVFANESIISHTNVWMHGFDDETDPQDVKTNNTRWKIVEFMVGGHVVAVCTGYLSASYTGWDNMPSREAQLTEVFETITNAGYQYAIICADFNCSASTEYQGEFDEVLARYPANEGKTEGSATNYDAIVNLAKGYGFTPANDVYWGVQNTYVNHNGSEPGDPSQMTDLKPLDNILIKGNIRFRNFEVLGDRYAALSSDHYPVIADVYIY